LELLWNPVLFCYLGGDQHGFGADESGQLRSDLLQSAPISFPFLVEESGHFGIGLKMRFGVLLDFKSIISSMSLTNVSAFIFALTTDDTAYGGEFARREMIAHVKPSAVSFLMSLHFVLL